MVFLLLACTGSSHDCVIDTSTTPETLLGPFIQ